MTAKTKNVKLTYPFNKSQLTKYDIMAINRLYGCSAKGREIVVGRQKKN